VAVGQWAARGKEQLVLLRPYGKSGLILHQLYYANEVRNFDEIDPSATLPFSDAERELGRKLIEQLGSDVFDPSKYRDEYAARVVAAVERKVKGEEVTVAHEHPRGQIIDLFEALKKSLETAPEPPSSAAVDAAPRPPAKAKSRATEVSPRPLKKTEPKRSRKRAANT
jgi:DNA end-binding protein Ku